MSNLVNQIQMSKDLTSDSVQVTQIVFLISPHTDFQPRWESIPKPKDGQSQKLNTSTGQKGKCSKYPKNGQYRSMKASKPLSSMTPKLPTQWPALPSITEKMANLTMIAKKMVKDGNSNLIFDWPELDKLNLGVKKTDLPVLSRLFCEQRNWDWGMPSTLADLSPPRETDLNLEPMVSPLNPAVTEQTMDTSNHANSEVNPGTADNHDSDDQEEVGDQAPSDGNKTVVGDEHHISDEDSQERRVQNLECLTQTLPGSSKKKSQKLPFPLRSIPWGYKATPSKFQQRPASESDDDEDLPQLEEIPSPKTNLLAKKVKRVRVNLPDSPPPSPIITSKDLKRARVPQTRSQSSKKLKGWYKYQNNH